VARGTIFLDTTAAKAAAAKAVPGLSWTPVATVPSATEPVRVPRVGIYKPWAASMDEAGRASSSMQYGFDPKTARQQGRACRTLSRAFDAIVLPDVSKEVIATGKPRRDEGAMRYSRTAGRVAGGLDKDGAAALRTSSRRRHDRRLSSACEYLIDELGLPVRTPSHACRTSRSPVRCCEQRATGDPLTYGLPPSLRSSRTSRWRSTPSCQDQEMGAPRARDLRDDPADVLLSGWMRGPRRLHRKAAAVRSHLRKGRVVLLGFRAQHRAQTPPTFPFLFNAI